MRMKKFFYMVLSCIAVIGCLCINTGAISMEQVETVPAVARATGRFSMDVSAGVLSMASTSFPLEVGETVTIKASYSPFSASVDFGLVDSDGLFHYVNVTNGSIDRTIEINQRGNYTFAVRNNSSETISVSGYVNY